MVQLNSTWMNKGVMRKSYSCKTDIYMNIMKTSNISKLPKHLQFFLTTSTKNKVECYLT